MKRYLRIIVIGLCAVLMTGLVSAQSTSTPDTPLPLLTPGLHLGTVYSTPEDETAKAQTDVAFGELIQAGLNGYELAVSWRDLEKAPGEIDTSTLETLLAILDATHLQPYLSITTINTVKLTIPDDLMTADEYELADGRHFDDPVIIERFNRVLDAIVPLMSKYGGFFISVGNEVNGWLKDRPAEVDGVVAFTAAARDYIHQIEPGMGVGITVGQSVLVEDPALLERLLAVSDAAAYTYYPMNSDFSVREPSGTAADIAEMIAAVGDLPVLFQEVGYPSGYTDAPGNNSSGEKQRDFFETFFTEIEQYPQVRFASLLQLADWSTGQCDAFVQYYTDLNSVPQVHEYLCSLGIRQHDGTAKPAYDAFLEAVRRIHAG